MTSETFNDPAVRAPEAASGNQSKKSGLNRRSFLATLGVAGAGVLHADRILAQEAGTDQEPLGVLIDTTRCIGCRTCEFMCAEAHGFPEPDPDYSVLEEERTTSECQWTLVNQYETDAGLVYVKKQCMHCMQPACTSACLTKAMFKTDEGPVVWRQSKCMGCRFCMISCPFDIPKFEYDSAVPRIQKCNLCLERREEGKLPVCVENCPGEALMFGPRSELIEEARNRIYASPDQYYHQIYGEDIVGGTSALYLSPVPFDQIGFRTNLGDTPYPEYTKGFLYSVPIILTLVPAFLAALSTATRNNGETTAKGVDNERL